MKQLVFLIFLLISQKVLSAEIIKIYLPYSPAHSAVPALRKILDEANVSQEKYKFLLEFKPGGNQIIAIKSITPENSLAIIAPAYIENIESGALKEADYIPVYALGNACWPIITNKLFVGAKEFLVGGVGYGNATHLTALALGEKYKFSVRYIIFKSNNDALINMTGNNGIEFVIDRYEGYNNLKEINDKLNIPVVSCPTRLPQLPEVPTLEELGITAPYIFNILVAHKNMPEPKRKEIENILNSVTLKIGNAEIYKLSAFRPPIFDGITAEKFYRNSIDLIKTLQTKYRTDIENSKK
jgi:hypothetical protein